MQMERAINFLLIILREDRANSSKDIYLELYFNVSPRPSGSNRYVDNNYIGLLNLGPVALFINYRLSSSIGEEIEKIGNAHLIRLMFKLIISRRDGDASSIGFHRNIEALERELINNKTTKGIFHNRICLNMFLVLQSIKKVPHMG